MQCNNSFCCTGYPNCGHPFPYAYNCSTGPQWFANPSPTFPYIAPRPTPQVIGEGEVSTVVLPDGTTQLYFLPLTKWCKPQTYPNQQLFGNNFQNPSCEVWFVRSVSKPTPPPFPYYSPNLPQPQGPVCCNVPCYPALKFHNDGWTSTTDLKYFYPGLRCTVCAVLSSRCISVQTSLHCNRGVANKSCEQKPSCCNAKCSYDNVKPITKDAGCDPISCMSIEENKPKSDKCNSRRGKNGSSSDCSSISACSLSFMSLSSENRKQKSKETKNSKKFKKKSEPCCCAEARKRSNKPKHICSECSECKRGDTTDDLCSFCNQTDDISKKNIDVQCANDTSASECYKGVRGDDCTVIKETNMIPSSCSNSTVNSALDYTTEMWIPKTEKCTRMDWCYYTEPTGRNSACCSHP